MTERADTIVIGAGIGGLAAALRLAHAGRNVHVIERAKTPGGKLRTLPSVAGPVDAGPTVFTMRPVFEALFASVAERLDEHLDLIREPVLARHWWPDGSTLDLHSDEEESSAAIYAFAGARAARQFANFTAETRGLFQAFHAPVMQSDRPDILGILRACLRNPAVLRPLLGARNLAGALAARFSDPRLRQLFGRYATYVGGSPYASPALLMLIWQAEAAGVWRIRGGMSALAQALADLAADRGAEFTYGQTVEHIARNDSGLRLHLASGRIMEARSVVFNGDPAALHHGLLGAEMQGAVPARGVTPRALSATVWSFAARSSGLPLAHHNVVFNSDCRHEFDAIARGEMPEDATLYICAQDRGTGKAPDGPERFEIIRNAPALPATGRPDKTRDDEEYQQCRTHTFGALQRMGLDFDHWPGREALTLPRDFAALFPGSGGSLYGRSPHGMMASFLRPNTHSRIPGLYLAGGGVHPGAGLPMALTSGRHAAEAILTDHASISRSRRMAMPGGMSTGSRPMANVASRL
ncbi:MAG: 1-hydroxycarotenoid 3,4-desaturase CrtD [Pseudomonadota bacterium]